MPKGHSDIRGEWGDSELGSGETGKGCTAQHRPSNKNEIHGEQDVAGTTGWQA
tara:strand:+ start:1607 stop:1765 length:159 start_codon:yes stop_codon:yes gene_type:complete